MNLRKIILIPSIIIILISCFSFNVFAGTYTATASVSVTPGAPTATVTNNAGKQWTDNVFRFSSPQANVSRIDWTLSFSVTQSMQIWYSTDGTTFTSAAIVSFTANVEKTVTINFGTPKTVYGMIVGPSTSTWPSYSITWYPPTLTYTLTDNSPPSISLSEQSTYSASSDTITANISDSQSGVSMRKWASGSQSVGYFASNGNVFGGGSFSVSSNGIYTIYAKDVAGNESVQIINATRIDNTPPSIYAAVSTTYEIYNTITANISDSQSGLAIQKWASGTQAIGYFSTGGTTFTGSTITVYSNGYYTIYAKDNVGNSAVYSVYVSYVDNTVTVTHPISINYTINPNNATPFSSPDISITNNSNIKVSVSVQQLNSIAGGSITFNDVLPTKYSDWSKLTASQTKTDIALGIRVKETTTGINTWSSISNSSTIYAANITSKTLLGILNPSGASGNLSVSVYSGIAWDNAYTSMHSLILVFDAS